MDNFDKGITFNVYKQQDRNHLEGKMMNECVVCVVSLPSWSPFPSIVYLFKIKKGFTAIYM